MDLLVLFSSDKIGGRLPKSQTFIFTSGFCLGPVLWLFSRQNELTRQHIVTFQMEEETDLHLVTCCVFWFVVAKNQQSRSSFENMFHCQCACVSFDILHDFCCLWSWSFDFLCSYKSMHVLVCFEYLTMEFDNFHPSPASLSIFETWRNWLYWGWNFNAQFV